MGNRYNKPYYNKANICEKCGINFDKSAGHPYREYNKEGNWTGRWICSKCYQRYDANSSLNVRKSLRNHRTGNLDPNSSHAKGDKFEELTCIWRGVKNLNIENDNYNSPIDHSIDSELGIIQTKGSIYDGNIWRFDLKNELHKEFDNIICYCASRDGKKKRIYIFPWEEILRRVDIKIYKNPRPKTWYNKYRVDEKMY